jgi:hypothetical protein
VKVMPLPWTRAVHVALGWDQHVGETVSHCASIMALRDSYERRVTSDKG